MSYRNEDDTVSLVVRYHNTDQTQTLHCCRKVARQVMWGFISYINNDNVAGRVGGGLMADDDAEPLVVINYSAVVSMIINERD